MGMAPVMLFCPLTSDTLAELGTNYSYCFRYTACVYQTNSHRNSAGIYHRLSGDKAIQSHQTRTDLELADTIKSQLLEIELPKDSGAVGKPIVDLGFPKTALISIIKRNDKFVTPSCSTVLNEGDILLIIYENQASLTKVYEALKIKPETDPTPDTYLQG
jgi:K+/H+ antiporter YhaU regulatory subunit KhtT